MIKYSITQISNNEFNLPQFLQHLVDLSKQEAPLPGFFVSATSVHELSNTWDKNDKNSKGHKKHHVNFVGISDNVHRKVWWKVTYFGSSLSFLSFAIAFLLSSDSRRLPPSESVWNKALTTQLI